MRLERHLAGKLEVAIAAGGGASGAACCSNGAEGRRSRSPSCLDIREGRMVGDVQTIDLKDKSHPLGCDVDRAADACINVPRIGGC